MLRQRLKTVEKIAVGPYGFDQVVCDGRSALVVVVKRQLDDASFELDQQFPVGCAEHGLGPTPTSRNELPPQLQPTDAIDTLQ